MADLLIEQLCQRLAEKLQAAPMAGINDLIAYLQAVIESDVTLKAALTEKAVQINQGDATGYQVLVEGGRAYIGEHLYVSDPALVETVLDTMLTAYLSKPVTTPSNLPLSGVVQFVGRDQALETVHQKLQQTPLQQTRMVTISSVSGMGGVGKTELALQYAYRQLSENAYPGGICWINARSQDVGVEILEFARNQLGLPQPPEHLQTLTQQVKWVCGRWQGEPILLVLDDVTDYAIVEPYLQQLDPRFQVLITTRLKLGAPAQRLELEVLTESAALELLRVLVNDATRIDSQFADAQRLCEWLGWLPLGLELVGRYLARKQDLSLAQMLERLRAKKLAAQALVQAREMTAQLGVAAAFELTWTEPDFGDEARELCGLLSVFALAPIPWELVEQCLPNWDQERLEDCRDHDLLGRSLVSRVGQSRYQLHQLIREFFAVKLGTELTNIAETLQRHVAQVLTNIAKTIPPSVTLEVIEQVEVTLPHLAVVAVELMHLLEGEDKIWSLFGLAQVAKAQNRWQDAEEWLMRSLQICETQLGSNHPHTATSLNNLAEFYRLMGRYSEAEPLCVRSLQVRETQLGSDHPHTATSLNNLALLYQAMGRYTEAEPLLLRSLQISELQLGNDHPHTVNCLNNLAALYQVMGRYGEAEPLLLRSLRLKEIQLGSDHPHTAESLNNLAMLCLSMGRYSEAEPLLLRSLQICEAQLGSDHLHTASCLNNLSELYKATGRYSEAEPLCMRSLQISETQLGSNHPDTAQSLNNLAELYYLLGRYSEAEPLCVRSLQIRETQLGSDHLETAISLNSLATVYQSLGRYSEAEPLIVRSLQIKETQLGSDHPQTAQSLNNLAELYRLMQRYSEAEPLYVRSLQIKEIQLGSDHPDTAIGFNNLAGLYHVMERYSQAETLYIHTLGLLMKCLPEGHPYLQTCWNNFCYLIQQAVQSGRVGELSTHPTTQDVLRQMQTQNRGGW